MLSYFLMTHRKALFKMKVVINILKAIELILTAIWGVIFGIFTPLSLMYSGIVDESISEHYVLWVWLINSVVCYLAGTVIVMMKHYKIALCFHTVGLAVSIFIYGVFCGIYEGINAQNPAQLYMPIIAIFFVTLAIAVIANFKEINRLLSTKKEKQYEAAPSILGGEYTAKAPEKEKKSKRKGK